MQRPKFRPYIKQNMQRPKFPPCIKRNMQRPKLPRFQNSLLTYNHENYRLMHIAIRKHKFDLIMRRLARTRPEFHEALTHRKKIRSLCERDTTHPIYQSPRVYKWSRRIKKLAKPRPGLPETTEMEKPRFWRRLERVKRIRPAPRRPYKCRKRIIRLARPKRRFDVPVNQEDLFKVSPAALRAKCSVRVKQLAKAKSVPRERLDLYYSYAVRGTCHRTASEIKGSEARLKQLSKAKYYPKYKFYCKLPVPVPLAALTAVASPRVLQLAKPKMREEYEPTGDQVSRAAMQCVASQRICELAKPKKHHPEFRRQYLLPRPVSPRALHAQASTRVKELAKPKDHETTFQKLRVNPDAFKVKAGALVAKCSARIKSLAVAKKRR